MADAYVSDAFAQVRGFRVEIASAGGGKDVDTAWESVSGGELVIETTDTTIGGDKFTTTSPGHKSVGEITLRGAMTDKRAALCQWINETVSGKPWKRNVTVTADHPDGTVEAIEFIDCVLTAYVLPRLTAFDPAAGCGPDLVEEVRFAYREWVRRA